jgi:hypothetical protein
VDPGQGEPALPCGQLVQPKASRSGER